MKLAVQDSKTAPKRSDLLVVFAFEGEPPQLPPRVRLDRAATKGFKGELRETRVVDGEG